MLHKLNLRLCLQIDYEIQGQQVLRNITNRIVAPNIVKANTQICTNKAYEMAHLTENVRPF